MTTERKPKLPKLPKGHPRPQRREDMSGGAFDYQQYRIGEIADQIKEAILICEMKPETILAFEDAIRSLRKAEVYAQRVDWFLSGDDGEDSFHKRLAEDLAEITEKGISK